MPAMPSCAETAPSCITPSPRQASGPPRAARSARPARRWYWSAWRRMPARATGSPSSVKPAAPSVGELRHLGELPRRPGRRVTAARKPVGIRASLPRALAQRAQDRSRCPPPGRCSAARGSRRSRPRRPRACRSRCPPRPRGPGVRRWTCGSTNAGTRDEPVAVDHLGALGRRRSRVADLRDLAVAHAGCRWAPSRPARGSSSRAPRIRTSVVAVAARVERRARRSAAASRGPHRARARARRRRGVGARRSGEQLVEHRHPHHDSRLDLLGDQRLRRVDHLGATARRRG